MHAQIDSDKNEQYITLLSLGESRLLAQRSWVWLLEGELCWVALEPAEEMQLLRGCTPGSGRAGAQQSSGRLCWEQLVCVWVTRDRELGHGGGQELCSSLLLG